MITIKKSDFDRLRREHPDYISKSIVRHEWQGKVCEYGDYVAMTYLIKDNPTPDDYYSLSFEHIHFEIV